MEHRSKRVGLFGGTFDPVHNGHISAAKSFLNSEYIDLLWVLLNPAPPHKQEAYFTPYSYRLQMLEKAFASIPNTKISDVETHLPEPCYTIQTIHYLINHYPDFTFYLCIGYDSFATFRNWHQWKQILEYCTLLVADRPSEKSIQADRELSSHTKFIEHQALDVSSSEIRENIREGKPVNHLVPASVLKFIETNELYR